MRRRSTSDRRYRANPSDSMHSSDERASTTAQEQEQLAALRESASKARDNDFEGGFGGQEDLEDRYATTSGEH